MDAADLRRYLSQSRIKAQYQPIVLFSDGAPIGLETLARLDHPARGLLEAEKFVPQLEEAGLAPELTYAVTERAFSEFSHATLPAGVRLGLNLSLDVLLIPGCLDSLDKQRRAAGLPTARITLEVTESRPLDDIAGVGLVLERLHTAGYVLALDDLSPAVPHHALMLDMPFSIVKLDKSVVQARTEEAPNQAFLFAVLRLAARRALSVIAEGVEDEATWCRMKALGLRGAQGYFVSRPLCASQVPAWFEQWRGPGADACPG